MQVFSRITRLETQAGCGIIPANTHRLLLKLLLEMFVELL
jgi:hypothetical protein